MMEMPGWQQLAYDRLVDALGYEPEDEKLRRHLQWLAAFSVGGAVDATIRLIEAARTHPPLRVVK